MKRKQLPAAPEASPRPGVSSHLSPIALERWNPAVRAAAGDTDAANTISIYDVIGPDFWGEGVTAKRIAGALRAIGPKDVTVNINSPGGDVFEGLAIYNLLRDHPGHVTVKVMGLAASAASLIAMAGDEIQIGRAAFLMVHNTWVSVFGNRIELREIADWLEPFDNAMADIYSSRTGIDIDDIKTYLDAETWIGGQEAVDLGWANSLLPADQVSESPDASYTQKQAARKMDVAMARAGIPRSERRALMNAFKSDTPGAVDSGTPCAATSEEDTAQTLEAYAIFENQLCNVYPSQQEVI